MNFTNLTEYLDMLIKSKMIPGADCIIMYKHKVVYRHCTGWFDIENKIPAKKNALYYLYSATKPITCTAAMTLYEKGKFLLSDPLYEYIPEFKDMWVKKYDENGNFQIEKARNVIRIIDLFTMSAGLNYCLSSDAIKKVREKSNGACPTIDIVKALADEPLEFEPGEHFNYSLCHDVLGGLIEIISGKSLGEYMKEVIFKPLGMNDTGFKLSDKNAERLAKLYSFEDKPILIDNNVYCLGSEYESGGAGLISSVDDYIKFLECLCNCGNTPNGENILSKSTIDLMRTNQLDKVRLNEFWESNKVRRGYGYGLGVRTVVDRAMAGTNASLGAFGWPGAAGAYTIADPDLELSVFYAQHITGMNALLNTHPRIRNIVYS